MDGGISDTRRPTDGLMAYLWTRQYGTVSTVGTYIHTVVLCKIRLSQYYQ